MLNGTAVPGGNSNKLIIGPIQPSTAQYQLIVEVDGCVLNSDIFALNAFPAPVVAPDYTLSSPCGGGHLQLSANISNTIGNINYQWVGPNGFTSKSANPLIANVDENSNGTYSLTVKTIYGCEVTESIVVSEITNKPMPPIALSNSPICAESNIELRIQEADFDENTEFIWLDGNGNTIGTEKTITLVVNENTPPEPYRAAISVNGCASALSAPVRVEFIEMPQVDASNSGPVCRGEDVQLMASGLEGASYSWYDAATGALISNQQNPVIFDIKKSATFNLKVEIEGCFAVSETQTTVEVDMIPDIENISHPTSYCAGETALLTTQSRNPLGQMLTYTWTGPNGFAYTAETDTDSFALELPDITESQAGAYQLTVSSPNNCVSATRSVIVNVHQRLQTPALSAKSNLICGGEDIELTADLVNGTGISYEWYQQSEAGDLFLIKTSSTPSLIINNVNPAHSGEYLVRIVKGACASGYSNVERITVIDATSSIEAS